MILKFLLIPIALVNVHAAPSNLINPFILTSSNCEKNIRVKYQVPVTRTRVQWQNTERNIDSPTEKYVEYEERQRWDTVSMCCPGYRTILFGLCEPICKERCPHHSLCVEPNKCDCKLGYAPSHHPNKEHQLICRPICIGGCPEHSHCMAPNRCECRPGFKDTSVWFTRLHCERIQCSAMDQRYDIQRHTCVKIEMSVEELMQKVGEKLAHGELMDSSEEEEDNDELWLAVTKRD